MLHAFKLGNLSVAASGFRKASLTGANLGAEEWAYVPMHSLPYLKYFTDKDYSHLYFNDGRTVIFDASIGDTNNGTCVKSSYWLCDKPTNGSISMVTSPGNALDPTKNVWRTVLIAGMGLGGASRDNVGTETCTEGATGSCVKTPVSGVGFSSYYALDVTYPESPKFLWEFSNNLLGFSTSAPAIVRIGNSVSPKDTNGRWFAVFGNGPFGPIDAGTHQFKAESNRPLTFFIVDLNATPPFVLNTNYWIKDTLADGTQIANAFAGTLLGGSIDADRRDPTRVGNYSDDAIYAGYTQLGADSKWSDGGVVRILTKEDQNPANWVVSPVISGIGPVTTAVARLQDAKNRNLWLYFGSGRFFYRDATALDDNDTRRAIFGIQEPCYNTTVVPGNVLDPNCVATLASTPPTVVNHTSSISTLTASNKGWTIDLAEHSTTEGAERVVTDTVALTNGTVFFTTFKPTMDICGYGGNSQLRVANYSTGGAPRCDALQGKVLIQLSTGEFKEIALAESLGCPVVPPGGIMPPVYPPVGGDAPAPTPPPVPPPPIGGMTGKPPSDAPPIVSSSMNKPVKKILHIQEH
jgi:type IV pilus assembly protein PilY1